jgi:hypothetical protein
MRTMLVAVLLLALCGAAFGSPTDRTQAEISLTIEMYVDLTDLQPVNLLVPQDEAPDIGTLIGGDQTITLYKNCDVAVEVDATNLDPDPATAEKGAQPLPIDMVSINGQVFRGGVGQATAYWVYCTEKDGEDLTIDYWWLRNGLCDHAGTYSGLIVVTAVGIDP